MDFYKKKLLILGAGIYQVPLIQKAKELGCYTVVTSIAGDYPGFEIADRCYYSSTKDADQILEIAESEDIDGICTTGTDVAVKTLGYVCDQLGLNGISYETGEMATNKINMKKSFRDYHVRTADFRVVTTLSQALQAFNDLRKPILLKTPDSSGSRGIVKVESREEISDAFHFVGDFNSDGIIAEEFIEGKEFGAQGMVVNHSLEFMMPHGDLLYSGKTNVPIGHYVPLVLNEIDQDDLYAQALGVIEALKLNNCAINFDFMVKGGEVYVIEAGARAGATCLPELVSIHYGIDYYESIIQLALDMYESKNFLSNNACGNLLLYGEDEGIFDNLELNNKRNVDITEFRLDVQKGDLINKFSVGPDRIGHVIVNGDSESDVLDKLNYLQESYIIDYAK